MRITAQVDHRSSAPDRRVRFAMALLAASAIVNGTTAAVLAEGFVDFTIAPLGGLLAIVGGVLLFINRHSVTGSRWWLLRLAIIASVALVGFSLRNMATSAKNHEIRYAPSAPRMEPAHGRP